VTSRYPVAVGVPSPVIFASGCLYVKKEEEEEDKEEDPEVVRETNWKERKKRNNGTHCDSIAF